MKFNFQNSTLQLPLEYAKSTLSKHSIDKTDLIMKCIPVIFILLTAALFKSWPILFALLYIPVQYLISALRFYFDLGNLDLDYSDIINDLEGQ